MNIWLRSSRILEIVLFSAILVLMVCGAVSQSRIEVLRLGESGMSVERVFVRWFNPDGESNIPTWFSSMCFMAGGAMATIIGLSCLQNRTTHAWRWLCIGAAFVFASVDEVACFHEGMEKVARLVLGLQGDHVRAWVVPALAGVACVAWACAPLFRSLPKRMKWMWVIAAGVFLAGAVGSEVAGGLVERYFEDDGFLYSLTVVLEETLEMLGSVLFLQSLLRYGCRELAGRTVEIGAGPQA